MGDRATRIQGGKEAFKELRRFKDMNCFNYWLLANVFSFPSVSGTTVGRRH
jgi:hypothetical protein